MAYPLHERPWRRAYSSHKGRAKAYNIEFLLTFEEWRDIWLASGKWEERGRFSDQYGMARTNDVGPYAVGNVRIASTVENGADQKGRPKKNKPMRRM